VLFILDSGAAYLLAPSGRVHGPIALGNNAVIGGVDIARKHEALIAGYGAVIRVDERTGVVKPKVELGSPTALAVTPDDSYLLASEPLYASVFLLGLTQRSRVAALCEMAGGLTRQAWSETLGRAAGYEPVCDQFRAQQATPALVARSSARMTVPLDLAPVQERELAHQQEVCRELASSATSGSIGPLGWVLPSSGSPGVICRLTRPLWVIPVGEDATITPGGSPLSPLLLFSSSRSTVDPHPSSEIIGASGKIALRMDASAREVVL
jgi:hypothetical protein